MPLEFAERPEAEQRKSVREIYENYGNRTREFRNGLGLAVPSSGQIELLRQAVRYSLAIERVQGKWREFNLTDAQRDQLKERKATEQSATESALLRLYGEVWLPKSDNGSLSLEAISIGGRPLQITLDEKKRAQIHQSLMDLLVTPQRWFFASVAPGKIVGLFKLGERDSADLGIATNKVVAGFFSFLDFPRLLSSDMVRRANARGVQTGVFGYATGSPALGTIDVTKLTGAASPLKETSLSTRSTWIRVSSSSQERSLRSWSNRPIPRTELKQECAKVERREQAPAGRLLARTRALRLLMKMNVRSLYRLLPTVPTCTGRGKLWPT